MGRRQPDWVVVEKYKLFLKLTKEYNVRPCDARERIGVPQNNWTFFKRKAERLMREGIGKDSNKV